MNPNPDDPGRDPAADDETTSPLAEQQVSGHLIRKLPKDKGVSPPHVEFFAEDDTDGFKGDEPRFVAFCPDCGTKLTLEQHENCPFFGGPEKDSDGFVIAVHCGMDVRGREKPKK